MPESIMPVVTGLFLVLIGMGVGYFLWHRDRTRDEAIRTKLRRENDDLKKTQAEHDVNLRESQNELTIREGKLHILQELCDDLVSGRAEFQLERIEIETELCSQRRQVAELNIRLEQERQIRIDQADKLETEHRQARVDLLATENEWRDQVKRLEMELAARQTDVIHLTEHSNRSATDLHETKLLVASLHTELETQRLVLDTATRNASGLEKEYVSLETSLRNHTDLLKESRSQAVAAHSAREMAENALLDLRGQLNDQQLHLENLEKIRTESESAKQECAALRENINSFKEQVIRLKKQRNEAIEKVEATFAHSSGLVTRLENQESTIRNLREQLDQQVVQRRTEAEARLIQENEERARLTRTRSELQHRIQELESIRIINEELNCQAAQADKDRRKFRAVIEQLEQNLLTKIAESSEFNKQIVQLKSDRAQLAKNLEVRETSTSQQLAKIRARVEQLQRDAMQHQARITTLIRERQELVSQLAGFEEMHQESAQLLDMQRNEIQSRLQLMLSQRDQAFDEATKARSEADVLRSELESRNALIAELKSVETEFVSLPFSAEKSDPVYGGKTRMEPRRGRIYTEPPVVRDNLQRISGIAEVLERRLNEYGVYTYEQIMEWDETAVQEFSTLLKTFKDRIQRDGWIEQASTFYQQTYQKRAA